VLTDVTTDMVITKEEAFGPVAPLYRFKTEAIKMANDTEFGLASYFYSRDIGRIWRVAEVLEYGIVGINEGIISTEIAPFGGMKESGIGPSGGLRWLEIRHRGIPRGQIPLHGRHRPLVAAHCAPGMMGIASALVSCAPVAPECKVASIERRNHYIPAARRYDKLSPWPADIVGNGTGLYRTGRRRCVHFSALPR
jgi:hypothetical protein